MITFWQDRRGSVAIIVAVSAMVLVTLAGPLIDIALGNYVRSSLQTALDSAALAAGKADVVLDPQGQVIVADTERALLAVAQRMFNANNRVTRLATAQPLTLTYSPPVGLASDSVFLTASARMPTNFLRLIGIRTLNITVRSKAERPQPGPIDLALVLDTTLSMDSPPASGGEKKIITLKKAATLLVEQLMVSRDDRVQISVVPYNNLVNVGLRNPVPNWVLPIDRAACTEYKREVISCGERTYYDCLKDGVWTKNGCWNQDCQYGPTTCVGPYTSTWGGCIGARSVISNNPANIFSNPWTADYLDKISSPTNPKYSGQSLLSTSNNYSCPKPIVGLTSNKASVTGTLSGLVAIGDTHIPTGLIWGWNVLDPDEPYSARTSQELAAVGGKKYLLLMTDGINATSPRFPDGAYLPNGTVGLTPEWSDGTKSNQLTANICQYIKDAGIEIFTVRFDVPVDTPIDRILKNCATDAETMSFSAQDTQGLLNAFRQIADSLNVLKIVQ